MKRLLKSLKVTLIAIVAIVALILGVVYGINQRPVAEFGSVQEVAEDITDFYSYGLDRYDIPSGEYELGVKPNKRIVVAAPAPSVDERTVSGTRTEEYSADGTELSVRTSPDRHLVDPYFGGAFPEQMVPLSVHWNGEDIEVPVRIDFDLKIGADNIARDSDTGSALLALDPDQSYDYVVRVVETETMAGMTLDLGDYDHVSPGRLVQEKLYADYVSSGEEFLNLKLGLRELPYTAMRGLDDGVWGYLTSYGPAEEIENLAWFRYRKLAGENERLDEIQEEVYALEDRMDARDPDDPYESLAEQREVLWEEREALQEALFAEAQETSLAPEWLRHAAEHSELSADGLAELVQRLRFVVTLEIISVNGIDVSG